MCILCVLFYVLLVQSEPIRLYHILRIGVPVFSISKLSTAFPASLCLTIQINSPTELPEVVLSAQCLLRSLLLDIHPHVSMSSSSFELLLLSSEYYLPKPPTLKLN